MSLAFHYQQIERLTPTGEETIAPGISLRFTEGGLIQDRKRIAGVITGLDLIDAPIETNCIELSCINGNGFWTTAVQTPVTRDVGGTIEYWIDGAADSNGDIYLVDVSTVCNQSGEPLLSEKLVYVSAEGDFRTREPLESGIKRVTLYRVTPTERIVIGTAFGEIPGGSLPYNVARSISDYTYLDNETDIETISLALIALLASDYRIELTATRRVYYQPRELDILFQRVIDEALTKLETLQQFTTSPRDGSLPQRPAVFSNADLLYNQETLYETNTFELLGDCAPGCSPSQTIQIIGPRAVSHRALAWLLTALANREQQDTRFALFREELGTYLIRQIQDSGLINQGWTNAVPLSDSALIPEQTFSTNVALLIGLYATYQSTQDLTYLYWSSRVYEALFREFWDGNTFQPPSRENQVYGLILGTLTRRQDITQNLSKQLLATIQWDWGEVTDWENNLERATLLTLPITELPYQLADLDSLLLAGLAKTFNQGFSLNWEGQFQSLTATYLETTSQLEGFISFFTSAYLLSNPLQFLDYDLSLLERYFLWRDLHRLKLKSFLPQDYGWFTEPNPIVNTLLDAWVTPIALQQITSQTPNLPRLETSTLETFGETNFNWTAIANWNDGGFWDEFISGGSYRTGVTELTVPQPIQVLDQQRIEEVTPLGIELNLTQEILVAPEFSLDGLVCVGVSQGEADACFLETVRGDILVNSDHIPIDICGAEAQLNLVSPVFMICGLQTDLNVDTISDNILWEDITPDTNISLLNPTSQTTTLIRTPQQEGPFQIQVTVTAPNGTASGIIEVFTYPIDFPNTESRSIIEDFVPGNIVPQVIQFVPENDNWFGFIRGTRDISWLAPENTEDLVRFEIEEKSGTAWILVDTIPVDDNYQTPATIGRYYRVKAYYNSKNRRYFTTSKPLLAAPRLNETQVEPLYLEDRVNTGSTVFVNSSFTRLIPGLVSKSFSETPLTESTSTPPNISKSTFRLTLELKSISGDQATSGSTIDSSVSTFIREPSVNINI